MIAMPAGEKTRLPNATHQLLTVERFSGAIHEPAPTPQFPAGWTSQQYVSALADWNNELSARKIARKIGKTPSAVTGVANRWGWRRRGSPIVKSVVPVVAVVITRPVAAGYLNRAALPAGHPITWKLIAPDMIFPGARL